MQDVMQKKSSQFICEAIVDFCITTCGWKFQARLLMQARFIPAHFLDEIDDYEFENDSLCRIHNSRVLLELHDAK